MDGPGLEAADRTVVAASATAAALGRIPLAIAPVDRRGRPACCCRETSAVIFDLIYVEETRVVMAFASIRWLVSDW